MGGFYATQLPWFLLFGVAAGLVMVNAFRWTRRLVRFGRSKVHLDPPQGQIGGQLAGTILLPRPLPADRSIRFVLTCKRTAKQTRNMSAGGGAVRFANDYEDEQHVRFQPSMGSVNKLPFDFYLPPNQWATTPWNGLYSIQWKLQAFSDTGGVDYRSDFTVPIAPSAKMEGGLNSASDSAQQPSSSSSRDFAALDQDRKDSNIQTTKTRRRAGLSR